MTLEEIRNRTNYKIVNYNNTPIVVYDSHRCIIPVLWQAANENLINTPCRLIYFDQHPDALRPLDNTLELIKNILGQESEFIDIFNLTEFHLRSSNDDWLRAAMELNLISDVIWIGGHRDLSPEQREYTDNQCVLHTLYNIPFLDGVFGYQGDLNDLARSIELQPLWNTLGWEYNNGRFYMKEDEPILLDFDLDYFSFNWRSITKAWLPEFFNREFLEHSHYSAAASGWTGKFFVKSLIKRAPIITVAKETAICGGETEVAKILKELNEILFDSYLDW